MVLAADHFLYELFGFSILGSIADSGLLKVSRAGVRLASGRSIPDLPSGHSSAYRRCRRCDDNLAAALGARPSPERLRIRYHICGNWEFS